MLPSIVQIIVVITLTFNVSQLLRRKVFTSHFNNYILHYVLLQVADFSAGKVSLLCRWEKQD